MDRCTFSSVLLTFLYMIISSLCGHVEGCGFITHIEIGERIKHFLDLNSEGVNYTQLILKHPDAYQAGCPYPDAFYPGLCFDGNFHDVSEETHWTPFMNATINYIRHAYPRPWSEAGEKLVVFLLAVIQHQVADVNWHSLGIDQGFLETMGKVNYHGSFNAAHNDGDFGGDVLNLYGLDMDYIPLVGTWYIPVDDLLNIYTELYGRNDTMYEEVVVECTNWLFLGRLGENLGVIEYLYPEYAAASTFLVDRLQDFFLGGIDDMAVWSGNVYSHAVTMLDHGTDVCDLPRNPIYIQCNELDDFAQGAGYQRQLSNDNSDRRARVPKRYDWLKMAIDMVHPDDYVIEPAEKGVYFKTTEHYDDRLAAIKSLKNNNPFTELEKNYTSPDVYYRTNLNYSRLGEVLLAGDVNSDGDLDLVISAPGYSVPGNFQRGRVYIVYGSSSGLPMNNITLENEADLILDGPELNGRFGTAVALVDLNADGYSDLAVSAPTVGSDALEYFGQVYVYFGSVSGLSQNPDVTITCGETYCNLGWSLTSGDINNDGYNDLLIGAPFAPSGGQQRGFVGVLYSNIFFTGGNLGESDFDWRYNGEQDYEWFGFSVTRWNQSPDGVRVVVGAPSFRLCDVATCPVFSDNDIQAVGKVYAFQTPLSDAPLSAHAGNVSFGQLGYTVSGSVGSAQNLLGVAATTEGYGSLEEANSSAIIQLGHVSIYDGGDISGDPFFSVEGDRPFGRTGSTIKFLNVNGDSQTDVILSSPLRSDTLEDDREAGRVYIFLTDESMRGEVYTVDEADIILGLGENKARYGYSVAPLRSATGQVHMAISAPHSNHGGRLSGVVTVHQL